MPSGRVFYVNNKKTNATGHAYAEELPHHMIAKMPSGRFVYIYNEQTNATGHPIAAEEVCMHVAALLLISVTGLLTVRSYFIHTGA
jgi:hypothetical protein